jgi:hypothetical protein
MGLDFGIKRRRKGENYKNLQWEEVCSWRNCFDVKNIFYKTIKFDEENDGEYGTPISIGAMQVLIGKLSDELLKVDLNNLKEVDEYTVNKTLLAIQDLSKIVDEAILDCCYDNIEYDYVVFDSY